MTDWNEFIPLFNKGCEDRGSVYRVGFTLDGEHPCVLQDGDSVVCQINHMATNAVQNIMRICMALEASEPKGL